MVNRRVALGFLVKLEHREVDHPERAPTRLEQAVFLAELAVPDLDPQRANGVVHHLGPVGTKENQVAILCVGALQHRRQGPVVEVLDNRALQPVSATCPLVDLDVGQALGTIDLDELGISVNLPATQAAGFTGATGNAQTHHATVLHGGSAGKDLEIHIRHDIGELGQRQLDTQIRFVRAVLVHGLAIGHHREHPEVDLERT